MIRFKMCWRRRIEKTYFSGCGIGRFCIENSVWCRVPGQLYPYPQGTAPEHRARSYLIIEPEGP